MGAPELPPLDLAWASLPEHGGEVIYISEHTRVLRMTLPDGRSAVVKQVVGAQAVRSLRHEERLLGHLAGTPGIPGLLPMPAIQGAAFAMVDTHGTTLAEHGLAHRMSIAEIMDAGMQVARILSCLHAQRVIHKDINPSNLLVHADGSISLIDFNIASHAAEERLGFTHQNQISGTLAYISPEQTGRTSRAVDHRTDLYSLGITLFELAAGEKPFRGQDLLELVRAHLVSTPPSLHEIAPHVPVALAKVVARLLEKEPDRRYQSAEGLLHDLAQLAAGPVDAHWQPGLRDFAARLTPPSRLVGRDPELQLLQASMDRAVEGREPACLLISGDPGVGKTALINELRPLVTLRHGWFVSTKFDPYRQDGAGIDALRALGRLLLAEPEDRLAAYRERIAAQLGINIGFGPARLPEFALLLGPQPPSEASNPREAEARSIQATLDLLRGIASPERPLALVYDDLQWATSLTLQLFDAFITGDAIPGLLLIGAYRSREVDATHPLHALMARWKQLRLHAPSLHLANLPEPDSARLVADILRMPQADAAKLACALNEHTLGNPYDTVELINALRHEGLLKPDGGSWAWETKALRDYVGGASVTDVLLRRLDRLPDEAKALVQRMACLGGELTLDTLSVAAQDTEDNALLRLAPALEDGLLVIEQGDRRMLRFRHDRVHQAAFESIDGEQRSGLHLSLARAMGARQNQLVIAAEQYLHVAHSLTQADEKRHAAALFKRAAARAELANVKAAERYLSRAIELLRSLADPQEHPTLRQLLIDHHRALYSLGRLDEADAVYDEVVAATHDAVARVGSTAIQLFSLAQRGRHADAFGRGRQELAALGFVIPDDPMPGIGAGLAMIKTWLQGEERLADFERPLMQEPRLMAIANLVRNTGNAAYFCAPPQMAWLMVESLRLWIGHGPSATVLSSAGSLPFFLASTPQLYAQAHELALHMVSVGQARGLEPGTSAARYAFAVSAQHWLEPLEKVVRTFPLARSELLRAGDAPFVSYTYLAGDPLLDCAPSLDQAEAEYLAGWAFSERKGNTDFQQRLKPRLQFVRALRGTTHALGSLQDDDFDEQAFVAKLPAQSTDLATYHVVRTMCAALFGDTDSWLQHAKASLPLMPRVPGYYFTAVVRALLGAGLAIAAHTQTNEDKAKTLEQLDHQHLPWLQARAVDAPENFAHLVKWVQAERAWAFGSAWEAGLAFEQALELARKVSRPWHLALITERVAQLHQAMGMEKSSRELLTQALNRYEAWGAAGKARQLRRDHPHLRAASSLRRAQRGMRSTIVSSDMVDLMAVLRASQALSSQTSLQRLTAELEQVLSAITGATSVHLALRTDHTHWYLAHTLGGQTPPLALDDAGSVVPLSAVRYVERVGELLVLDDACADDNHAGDPCLAGAETCSLLVAPLHSQGELRAMLILQNRMLHSAFNGDHLDAVQLIAGQLSVSIDNALLYASLEHKVAERTTELAAANAELERLSMTDALTGVANRRRFDEELQDECLRAARNHTALALVILDIDHFKLYNDHYGHQGGDAALQAVAQALTTGLREGSDLLARYGGEEFVMLLPQATHQGCARVAERARAAVQALQLPHEKSPFGQVTISLGLAIVEPTHGFSPESLVARADAALYLAKEKGRNRVVASGEA